MGNSERLYLAGALAVLLTACGTTSSTGYDVRPEVHGHRGCRGLMPENTIPAFTKAAELGCEWLEMDVVITGDSQVLVSHEPWMDHRTCRTPKGDSITPAQERGFNIYRMTLEEAQAFDCGSAHHPDFPDQEHMAAHKPTLRAVVETIDELAMEQGLGNIGYNIEIKSEPALYDSMQPPPATFVALVLAQIDSLNLDGRVIIQSFDPAVLEAVYAAEPDVPVALLVDNTRSLEDNLARISFPPAYYSPAFSLVDKKLVKDLAERDIQLLVWTVNDKDDLKRAIKLGVNGIITDYPDRAIGLLDEDE